VTTSVHGHTPVTEDHTDTGSLLAFKSDDKSSRFHRAVTAVSHWSGRPLSLRYWSTDREDI